MTEIDPNSYPLLIEGEDDLHTVFAIIRALQDTKSVLVLKCVDGEDEIQEKIVIVDDAFPSIQKWGSEMYIRVTYKISENRNGVFLVRVGERYSFAEEVLVWTHTNNEKEVATYTLS